MMPNNIFSGNADAAGLADLIDKLMSEGSGHINIAVNEDVNEVSVKTVKSTDCTGKNGACCQPTEFSDDDED